MMNLVKTFMFIGLVLSVCLSVPKNGAATSINKNKELVEGNPRVLMLGGVEYIESETSKFIFWKCRDYHFDEKTVFEFGHVMVPDEYKNSSEYANSDETRKIAAEKILNMIGFVLYEGTNKGDLAFYEYRNLNHRWDWGPGGKFSFVIKADGTGIFYNFTSSEDGEHIKPDNIYKCGKY